MEGYDWSSLPPGSVVVDVGGGIGVSSLQLAKSFPDMKLVVQDRAAVVKEALEVIICYLQSVFFHHAHVSPRSFGKHNTRRL